MFDHVVFGVSDYAASKAFFLKALEPLGVTVSSEGPLGVELVRPGSDASLCIRRVEEKATHLHLAFQAENRGQVDRFYRAAIEAGATDNGPPGFASSTTRTTMRPSSLVPMDTTSKWFVMNRGPDQSARMALPAAARHWR